MTELAGITPPPVVPGLRREAFQRLRLARVLFRSIRGENAAKELKNRAWRVCNSVEHFGSAAKGGGVRKSPAAKANLILFSTPVPCLARAHKDD